MLMNISLFHEFAKMHNDKKNVVIIGGGLVGSLCACFLAKRGYHIQLYEAREDPRKAKLSRGRSINLALSHRGRRALRSVGLEKKVLENAIPMKGRLLHKVTEETKSVIYDEHTHQCIYSISRNLLNVILLSAAEEHPNVEIYFECKLKEICISEGSCLIQDNKTNEILNPHPDLIIGADGAFSKVRRCMQQIPLFQFSQTYIEHGYLELSVQSTRGNLMEPHHLHIWPRGKLMMIALPNADGSWTLTLFMSLDQFKEIDSKDKLKKFFETTFPDALKIIGEQDLEEQFFSSSPSPLVSIKCNPYNYQDRILIIGDAAHAMVPFYGQGMNCGFEDCSLLDELLTTYEANLDIVLKKFSAIRRDDAHAICDLAMYNFIEMRDLVTKPSYYLRKLLDYYLYSAFPQSWVPLYNSITFTSIPYNECMMNRRWQNNVISIGVYMILGLLAFLLVLYSGFHR